MGHAQYMHATKGELMMFLCFTVVLSEVIQAFSVPENAARMEEARESACNDMGKMLQLVLPVATQIQQEVIKAYGFNNEGEGETLQILIIYYGVQSLIR